MDFFDGIYVISLPSRQDRRDRIKTELERFNTPYTVFNAIDGRKATPLKHWYGTHRNMLSEENTKNLKPGEIGCILSHIRIWEEILLHSTKDGWYLIMEDDCAFDPRITSESLRECLSHLPKDAYYFKFAHLGIYKKKIEAINPYWNKVDGSSYSTLCYAVHTRILQSLLSHTFKAQVDHLIVPNTYVINNDDMYSKPNMMFAMGLVKVTNEKKELNYYHGICYSFDEKNSDIQSYI
jgi:GR25 family glycosyltransferase involved in LPS biosynthesis